MKYIIEVFSVMLVLVFNLLLCISMLGVSADVAAAKEFKAAMIAEIENSDFNPYVMAARRRQEQKGTNWKCSPTPTVDKATAGLRGSISIIDTGYHC